VTSTTRDIILEAAGVPLAGTLSLADLAARWFVRHLSSHPEAAHPTGAGTHLSSTRR
jgi:hypothetical protein